MSGRIPDDTLQLIRERVSIVEVVSGHVSLKRAGRNYLGLCPFHAEKTPSFTVSDERGLFHCFGCGAGGSVFTFLTKIENIGFRDAVELLARRAGVEIPKSAQAPGGEHRKELIELNELAQRHFREVFRSAAGGVARQYAERRGLSATIVEQYGVGFCPPSGSSLIRAFAAQRRPVQKAIALGLVGRRGDGTAYDRFRGRVTFPIRDGSGNIVGFGGRTLGDDHPKYLNSPESTLFRKGNVLYGLFEARSAIRDADRVVVVEGYLDALALVDAGFGNVVASLGTALTADQLRIARRFGSEVLVFFDGDRAGQQAALRAFALCVEVDIAGFGVSLPEALDPDSLVRQNGASAARELLEHAEPLEDVFLRQLNPGLDAPLARRIAAAKRIGEVLARAKNPLTFGLLVRKAAEQLGIDESAFREMRTTERHSHGPKRPSEPPGPEGADIDDSSERTLVEVAALDREVAHLVAESRVLDLFRSAELSQLCRAVIEAWDGGCDGTAVVDRLPAQLGARVTAALLGDGPLAEVDRVQVSRDCIRQIEQHALKVRDQAVRLSLREAEASGDERRFREELQRANEHLQRRKAEGHA